MNHPFFSGRKFIVILHVILWIALFILPTYLLYLDSDSNRGYLYRSGVQILLFALIFYANYLWLTPKFFFRKKVVLYFIAALLLISVATLVNERSFRYTHNRTHFPVPEAEFRRGMPPPGQGLIPASRPPFQGIRPSKNGPLYNFIITALFISGFGMGLCFADKLRKNEKERKEAEKEKLNTELAFLKNQINPHFFFNTLNNIYSLVQTSVTDGQKAILQLSKLMRYLLYETEKGDKLLSEEIEFMKTYIELMRLRISEKVSLDVNFPVKFNDLLLPPLLFLPFIENAFKHGISYRRPSFVNVDLKVVNGTIIFECSNSIGMTGDELFHTDAGIGLENVKKRLALLFPDRHLLKITETENSYTILLHINFQTERYD